MVRRPGMAGLGLLPVGLGCVFICCAFMPRTGMAQNDWQFPDPRFGILQSGRFPTPADEQRYRAEIAAATRPPRSVDPVRKRWRPRIRAGGVANR
jgi:hypothetical protein